jgi:hypothetical protein
VAEEMAHSVGAEVVAKEKENGLKESGRVLACDLREVTGGVRQVKGAEIIICCVSVFEGFYG